MKTTLALLCGGISSEDYLSRRSCRLLQDELDRDRYDIFVLDWQLDGTVLESEVNAPDNHLKTHPSLVHCFTNFHGDIVVNLTHGEKENCGQLQGLLDLAGIPYTGNDLTSSVIGMNKVLTKYCFRMLGIHCPGDFVFYPEGREDWEKTLLTNIKNAALQFPLIVKPVKGGSSEGMHLVRSEKELDTFLASHYDGTPYIFEEFIQGDDYCVGIFTTRRSPAPVILPVAHIRYAGDFFDASIKYGGAYSVDFPGELDHDLAEGMRAAALKTHEFLGFSGFSRCDFIIRENDFFALEVNTHPGMSTYSILPNMIRHSEFALGSLYDEMIEDALHRSPGAM